MSTKKFMWSSAMCSAVALVSTSTAWAQAPAPAEDSASDTGGEIVVTARKRSEDVLKTPVTVAVVTSEDIAKKGIVSLSDLATNTPGVNINNNSSGRADRSFQQIIVRGFTPSTSLATTTSTFIDGAPVSSPTALTTISDPARIEVLKGPQSAYFGRNTFAGAVNVVNKEPTGEWGATLSAMGGTRSNYRFHADVEGPIIGKALTFRISADQFGKDGSYNNRFTGDTMGDQSSRSITGLIVAKPFTGLTMKFFGLYSEDHDGPAAQALLSAQGLTDSTGATVVTNRSNCTLRGLSTGNINPTPAAVAVNYPFICGVAPSLAQNSPSANTNLNANTAAFLAKSTGRIVAAKDGVQDYGLLRRYHHLHAAIDYEIGDTGLTVSSITAHNRELYSTFVDLDNYGSESVPQGTSYFDFPFLIERRNGDFSQEFRVGFDRGGPFKATIGASYLNNWIDSDLGGNSGNLTNVNASTAGRTQSRTKGAFFALSYKFFDKLTINAEGRYQIDTLFAYAQPTGLTIPATSTLLPPGFYANGSLIARQTYKNFLPRIIAQVDFNRDLMIYASWSKGVNPGGFNTSFLTAPAATVAEGEKAGIRIGVRPEKVTNYEVGIKGRLLDGRIRYSLSGYYAEWRDQINSIALAFLDPTGSPQLIQGTANTGNVNMKGIELESTYAASDLITLNGAISMNDTDIRSFVSPTVSKYTGIFDYSGKEMPNTSKWSATAGIQFGGEVKGTSNATWFARGDYAYKSGVWSDQANIVRTPGYQNVNVRVGGTVGPVSLNVFMNNVFNDSAYTSIGNQFLFTPTFAFTSTFSALVVGLREKRTVGVQAKYTF